jgi:hypothetical protein
VGGVIPASGPVGITFLSGHEPVTHGSLTGVTGAIAGVPGTVTYTDSGLLFTRTAAGDPVNVSATIPFTVDTPYTSYIPVLWEGRNDLYNLGLSAQAVTDQILGDIAAQVATIPAGQDYLVFSILNADSPEEYKGGSRYQVIAGINNQLANIYGSHYLDVRSLLINAYDPTSVLDTSNYQHDVPPQSLRRVLGAGTLANAIGPDDTTITLNLGTIPLDLDQILTIDSGANVENVQISSYSGSTVTVVRGVAGTKVAHAAGSTVTEIDRTHSNPQGLQLLANAAAAYFRK